MSIENSKRFLVIMGYILIIGAILGFVGILGPTPELSIFGSFWWLSSRISLLFLVTGIISLFSAYTLAANVVLPLTFGIATIAFFAGLYGLLWSSRIFGVELAGPIGNLFGLIVGIWGIWAVSGERIVLMRRCRKGDMEACDMLGMQRAK